MVLGVAVAGAEGVSPALFVADTRKSQETPFVSEVTVCDRVAASTVVTSTQPLPSQSFSTR